MKIPQMFLHDESVVCLFVCLFVFVFFLFFVFCFFCYGFCIPFLGAVSSLLASIDGTLYAVLETNVTLCFS